MTVCPSSTAPIFDIERTPTIVSIFGNWTEIQRKSKHKEAPIEKIVVYCVIDCVVVKFVVQYVSEEVDESKRWRTRRLIGR